METHPLPYPGYPTLEVLTDALSLNPLEVLGLSVLGIPDLEALTFISPVNVCIISKILPERVILIYRTAVELIHRIHEENREYIEEGIAFVDECRQSNN